MTQVDKITTQQVNDDEINLRDLIHTLIKQKWVIVWVSASVIFGAALYALLTAPVYKTKASFLPPNLADVAALNYSGVNNGADPMVVYTQFEKNLYSLDLRRKIFDNLKLAAIYTEDTENPDALNLAFNEFNENISIEKPKEKKNETSNNPFLYLIYQGKDPQLIADVANQLQTIARDTTKTEIIRNVMEQINFQEEQLRREINILRKKSEQLKQDKITQLREADSLEIKELTDQIDTLRLSAKTKRMDYILHLTEAAKIAESTGLIEKSSLLETNVSHDKAAFYTEVTTQAQPLYLRGSKALRSEIKELEERKSDDPFIPGLRELQDKLELLKANRQVETLLARNDNDPFTENLREKEATLALIESFQINHEQVNVATLDQPAFAPLQREKPKRSRIVALGAVGGLFLGIIAAFMVNFWQTLRLEDEGTA